MTPKMPPLVRSIPRTLQFSPNRHVSRHLTRRLESSSSSPSHAHHHPDPAPANESFGRSFYLVLALVPTSYIIYNLSRPDASGQRPALTNVLERWSDYRSRWEERNAIHTRMVEQAGHDRNLFINTPEPNWHDLRMPEMMSVG